jgi:hypothetical protein
MKKNLTHSLTHSLSFFLSFFLSVMLFSGCSSLVNDSQVESKSQKISSTSATTYEELLEELKGDSLLPYFDFDTKGERIEYDFKRKTVLARAVDGRKVITFENVEEFYALEESYIQKLNADVEYRRNIMRPLDYVCRTSLLAISQDYSLIQLNDGEIIFSDKHLFESCEYIGFKCEGECDEDSENDPYLSKPSNAKLNRTEIQEAYAKEVTVEIYPYRMIASSFIVNRTVFGNTIYSTAGSETYFKKRQRVWRGLAGMVWRWAAFDPDRNGIRANCYAGCAYRTAPGSFKSEYHCEYKDMATDLDTWGDTEDITVRCAVNPFKFNFGVSVSETGNVKPTGGITGPAQTYEGGVIGSHNVKHGENQFKAKTSVGFTPGGLVDILRNNTISYR